MRSSSPEEKKRIAKDENFCQGVCRLADRTIREDDKVEKRSYGRHHESEQQRNPAKLAARCVHPARSMTDDHRKGE
ncbi:MAG: hypothetical protein ABGZ31_09480 [Roseibacillus sp.]